MLMNNFEFCKYFSGNSIIHKLDARLKIISSLIFFILTFSSNNIISLVIIAISIFIIAALSEVPLIKYIKSFKSVLIISLITAFINLFFEAETNLVCLGKLSVSLSGLKSSIFVFFRLVILVFISSITMFTTSVQEISLAFENLLSPLGYLGINTQEIAITITLSLRFIPVLFEETYKIINAQKVRGADFDSKNVIKKIRAFYNILVPLFIFSFRRAENIAISMESRCYDVFKKRTSLKTMKLSYRDTISIIFLLLIFTGVIVCNKIRIF